jgi:hypothetical protein
LSLGDLIARDRAVFAMQGQIHHRPQRIPAPCRDSNHVLPSLSCGVEVSASLGTAIRILQ